MRLLTDLVSVDFLRIFGKFSSSCWGLYQLSYIIPNKEDENLPKILKKSTETKSVNSLIDA